LQLAPFLLNQRPVVHDPIGADSPEDREAAEAARAEAQRRERRKVITLNKLGAAAEEVRRRFVKQLLARKTAPKGSAQFIARCLAWSPNLPADHKGLQIVNAMLGLAGDTHVADLIPVASSMALTGTAAQIPEKIAGLAALGVTEVVYQPAGSDIERELQTFASAAGLEG
jgi:hypothetical protein